MGEWSCSCSFLDLGIRWRWMVSFTLLPLYPQGMGPQYPLDGVGVDGMEKRKILHCRESNPDRPSGHYTNWAIPPSCALGIPNRVRSKRLRYRRFICTDHYSFAEVLTAVSVKSTTFWNVMPCSLIEVCRRFAWAYCRHRQCQRVSRKINKHVGSTCCLARLLFVTEDGGNTFLRNIHKFALDFEPG
jgi:hypothetical protein